MLILTLFFLSLNGSFLEKSNNQNESIRLFEPNLPGRYEKCISMLDEILAESSKMAALIAEKKFFEAIPLTIKLIAKLVEDVNCFKNGVGNETMSRLLKLDSFKQTNVSLTDNLKNMIEEMVQAVKGMNSDSTAASFQKKLTC